MEWIWYLVAFVFGCFASSMIPKDYTVKTCGECGGTGVDYYSANVNEHTNRHHQCDKCKGTGKVISK